MPPSVAFLISLLGAAALAGVHLAPIAKEDYVEEMVTRCIVEVLLNSLSKASAPPINPQCKAILRNNNWQKQEKENGGKDPELDMKLASELEERKNSPEGAVREEQDLKGEELKRKAGGDETWRLEGKPHGIMAGLQDITQDHSWNEAHNEERKKEEEKEKEEDKRIKEDGSYRRNNHNDEGSDGQKQDERHEDQDKKSPSLPEEETEGDHMHTDEGQRRLEEIAHREEENSEESKEEEEAEEEEEEEEESSEKYHHSLHREFEDSFERQEVDTEKRGHEPRSHHKKIRLSSSSEYKRHHPDEDSPEESSEEKHELWDKRSHYPKHYYEMSHHYEEKRNSDEMLDSEEMEGKSRTMDHQDMWKHSREDNESGDMRRHHSRENEEKQHPHFERERFPDEPQREVRHHYKEKTPHNKIREDIIGKLHSYGNRDEKRHQLQLEEMAKPQNFEAEDGEQGLDSLEEGPSELRRPSNEEEIRTRHHSEREKHLPDKRTLLMEEGYPRSHYLVENVKRAVAPYIPYYQQLKWKSRHAEKKDDLSNPFWGSEEEPRSPLNDREFFPEYSDYDLWAKKQLIENLNHKQNENNHPERSQKFDAKRQYNRMDELAHLLSNRKKSVEFPQLYGSKEDMKRGHFTRNGEGKLGQRPLTQDEEKELENLAAMDLELQKIVEKFKNNRRR